MDVCMHACMYILDQRPLSLMVRDHCSSVTTDLTKRQPEMPKSS
jgi:hypothetical protein